MLISDDDQTVAGHGRVEAAKLVGLERAPTIRLSHLSEAERRAYVLADNKLALNAGWDQDLLAIELQALIELDFDVTVTGFSLAEVDLTLDLARDRTLMRPQGRRTRSRLWANERSRGVAMSGNWDAIAWSAETPGIRRTTTACWARRWWT